MSQALDNLKEGDVVYATLVPGRVPMLAAVYPYKDPQSGKLVKMTEQELDGRKAPAAEIDAADGSKITAFVPGKLVNKRWVPDQMMVRQVRLIRPNSEILFVTHDQDGKPVLIQIAKAPPARARLRPAPMTCATTRPASRTAFHDRPPLTAHGSRLAGRGAPYRGPRSLITRRIGGTSHQRSDFLDLGQHRLQILGATGAGGPAGCRAGRPACGSGGIRAGGGGRVDTP